MTNEEYITKILSGLNVTSDDVSIILIKSGLNGSAQLDINACDNAIYNRMSVVLKGMTQNVTEGGYSVSWNMDAVKAFYKSLCYELGKPNVLRPVIRNKSNIW
jgi:hypothetical protein